MNDNSMASEIIRDGKMLILVAAGLGKKHGLKDIEVRTMHAFEDIAPYLQEKRQVLYIRDLPERCIDGEYPVVTAEASNEVSIMIPSWSFEARNRELIDLAIHQAMMVLARGQNLGSPITFGDDVVNIGMSMHYAAFKTKNKLPYDGELVTKRLLRMALRRWNVTWWYCPRWFAGGERSKWRAHLVGTQLAMMVVPNRPSQPFDVDLATKVPGHMLENQLWGMFHRGKRAIYARHGQARKPFWSFIY